MKTVLIICYNKLHIDPRVLRQIQALKQNYKILTIGYTQVNDNTIVYYPVRIPAHKRTLTQKLFLLLDLLINKVDTYEKILERDIDLEYILSQNIIAPDVIIANDLAGLYTASVLKSKNAWHAKIYFDAHEYFLNRYNASLKLCLIDKPIIIYALKKCKKDISAMSAVCEGIARKYESFFGFSAGFVSVITNAPEYDTMLKPTEVKEGVVRLIHHGHAYKARKLELMIKMMKYLDARKYELTFMMIRDESDDYYDYLKKLSQNYKNIKFIEPVQFSDIVKTINNYDIGVYILKPDNFNQKYGLPNKFFEFIQARLAIAVGPSIEMVKVIDRYALGVYSEDFSPKSLANRIKQMTSEEIMLYKWNSDKCARDLSAESNINKIRQIIAELENN